MPIIMVCIFIYMYNIYIYIYYMYIYIIYTYVRTAGGAIDTLRRF